MLKNNEKGFRTVDIGISMLIIILFVSIMSSMLYSVYLSSTEAKRTATALNYGVDIFEDVAIENYQSMTAHSVLKALEENLKIENLKTETSSGESTAETATGKIGSYKIKLTMISPYKDETIKRFTLSIEYPISKKETKTLVLERLRTIS